MHIESRTEMTRLFRKLSSCVFYLKKRNNSSMNLKIFLLIIPESGQWKDFVQEYE